MLRDNKNYLLMQKMGMDEPGDRCGDIHNYRIRTVDECIKAKDGRNYFLEFSRYDKYNYRTTNKRTGAPLKKAIRELELENALNLDTQYSTDSGSFRNLEIEKETRRTPRLYNAANVLEIVNSLLKEGQPEYDDILYVYNFTIYGYRGGAFTPRDLMKKYAADHRLETITTKYNSFYIKIRDKWYKYLCYSIVKDPFKNGIRGSRINLILEPADANDLENIRTA